MGPRAGGGPATRCEMLLIRLSTSPSLCVSQHHHLCSCGFGSVSFIFDRGILGSLSSLSVDVRRRGRSGRRWEAWGFVLCTSTPRVVRASSRPKLEQQYYPVVPNTSGVAVYAIHLCHKASNSYKKGRDESVDGLLQPPVVVRARTSLSPPSSLLCACVWMWVASHTVSS